MGVGLLHLHTYFFFPFSIDKETVLEEHPELWPASHRWIDGLDEWLAWHQHEARSHGLAELGRWQRAAYRRFDSDSPAYQDMVFFHPVVRRVFFDTADGSGGSSDHESLLRCYEIPIPEGTKLWLEAEDARGREAEGRGHGPAPVPVRQRDGNPLHRCRGVQPARGGGAVDQRDDAQGLPLERAAGSGGPLSRAASR